MLHTIKRWSRNTHNFIKSQFLGGDDSFNHRYWLHRLEYASRGDQTEVMAECHLNLANNFYAVDGSEQACDHYKKAAELYEICCKRSEMAHCLMHLGQQKFFMGKSEESLTALEKALETFEELDSWADIVSTLQLLSSSYLDMKEFELAQREVERAISLCQEMEDYEKLTYSLSVLATILQADDQQYQALEVLQEAVTASEKVEGDSPLAYSLFALGGIYLQQGEFDLADQFLVRSLNVWRQSPELAHDDNLYLSVSDTYAHAKNYVKEKEVLLIALEQVPANAVFYVLEGLFKRLAFNAYRLGDLNGSNMYHLKRLDIYKKRSQLKQVAECQVWLGTNYRFLEHYKESRYCFLQAVKNATKIKDEELIVLANLGFATIACETDQLKIAEEKCNELLDFAELTESREIQSLTLAVLGEVYAKKGDFVTAEQHHRQALSVAREDETNTQELSVLSRMGNVAFIKGETFVAEKCWEDAQSIAHDLNDLTLSNHLQNKIDKLTKEKV